MVRDGLYYGISLLAVAAVVWVGTHWISLTAIPVLLAVFFFWFFRDPERAVPTGPGLIVSPGDGKVEEAEWIETTVGSRFRVSIFLSVVDVHVNRAPIGGRVTLMEYREGQFLNAMNPESAILNEQTLIVIEDGAASVSFKQIAGLLARRIVCDLKTGDLVQRGQRMGMIKFGSRVDVLMPADVELRVKPGDRVQGGKSILGVLPGYGEGAAKKSSNGRG
jgi:phosphatidylserine decarboxylase